jgi:Tfp pilus assembly protein PilV
MKGEICPVRVVSRRKCRNHQAAALLIDVMIALFIGTLVMLSCIALTMTASAASDAARQNNLATNAGRQVLENLRAYKGATVANGTYADATVFGVVPQLARLSNGRAAVTISPYRAALKQVVVTVRWESGGRRLSRFQTVATLIGPEGVAP